MHVSYYMQLVKAQNLPWGNFKTKLHFVLSGNKNFRVMWEDMKHDLQTTKKSQTTRPYDA